MEASALSHPVGLGRLSVAGPLLRLRSDEQLVALFRAGHDEAFGVIHDRYRPRLFAYARQMLSGSTSDAEDVLQDVFLRAYHALRLDRRPVTLRAWLYRVAHNRCIDHLRRPVPAPADVFDLNRTPQHDPMAAAEQREDLRRLVQDVQRLPEQQRSALLMREMEGLAYSELADALGVTVPAVKSLLVRARIGLVEAIEARDTACTEIRTDLAAAFDRGVRASGRARRHVRECDACRQYRGALRGLEKRLDGLSPGAGPIATLAKVLGIGGSSAGAAAGGGAAAAGGGGAAAGGVGAATIGTGAVAGATSKVVAVVAAAAVVGGGAATVEQVQSLHPRRAPVQHAVPVSRPAAAPSPAPPLLRDRQMRLEHGGLHPRDAHHDAARAPRVARLDPGGPVVASPGKQVAPTYDTGGLQAPDAPTPADATGTGSFTPASATAQDGTAGAGSSTATATGTAGASAGGNATASPGTAAAAGGAAATGSAPAGSATAPGAPTTAGGGAAAAGSAPAAGPGGELSDDAGAPAAPAKSGAAPE